MFKSLTRSALVAGMVLAAAGSVASVASAQTLGEKLASGQISQASLAQLVSGTGLSVDEARALTLEDIVAIKWQDD